MAVADVAKFFAIASKDPAIMARLSGGPSDLPSIFGRVVTEGKHLGFTFTADDAEEYLNEQRAASPPAVPVHTQEKRSRGGGSSGGSPFSNPFSGLPHNNEPALPPTDSFWHFVNWFGGQVPPHYGRRR